MAWLPQLTPPGTEAADEADFTELLVHDGMGVVFNRLELAGPTPGAHLAQRHA